MCERTAPRLRGLIECTGRATVAIEHFTASCIGPWPPIYTGMLHDAARRRGEVYHMCGASLRNHVCRARNTQQPTPEPGTRRPRNWRCRLAATLCVYLYRLSPGLDNSTGNSTATRQVARQVARQLLDSYSTATRQLLDRTPLTPCDGGVKCQARQRVSSTDLDRPRQTSSELDRPRQSRADTDQLVRAPLLQGEG